MLPEVTQLFLAGFAAALGPCMLTCSPVVIPFIAGTSASLNQSIIRSLVFSLARLVSFVLLALVIAALGSRVIRGVGERHFEISAFIGALIAVAGIIILLGQDLKLDFCKRLYTPTARSLKGVVILGLLMGVLPCAAKLAVLTYIAVRAKTLWQAGTLAIAFGLGEVWSPVLLLAAFSGLLPSVLRTPQAQEIIRRSSGALILLFGLRLILLPVR